MKAIAPLLGAALVFLAAPCASLAQSALDNSGATQSGAADPAIERAQALNRSALELYRQGEAARASTLAQEALVLARQTLGERNQLTLSCLNTYALTLLALGRTREAEPLATEALAARRQLLGERDPETLESLSAYASVLEKLGRLQEAEPLFQQTLRMRREVLGKNHPETLASLSEYARALMMLGRAREAEPLAAQAMATQAEILGERHPETLASMHRFGQAQLRLGRPDEAERLARKVLQTRREVLGERHPDTLASMGSYATTLTALGRKSDALSLLSKVLQLRREVLGERHPQTLVSLNNYATELRSLGRVEEAEPLFAETLRVRTQTLGDHHPQTLNSLNNHAFVLMTLGRVGEAEPLLRDALRLRREVLGESHPFTLNSLNNYAFILRRLGRTEEAEPLYAQALELRRETLGARHPDTLQSLNNHANVLRALDRTGEAETLFAEALALYRDVLGERHPITLRSLNNYAVHLFDAVDPSKALAPYRELVAATRARAMQLSEAGLSGDAQRDRELAERQEKEKLFADILWANTMDEQADAAALRAEALIALQLASAGSTSKAVAEAAALRFASSEGLEELVQERQALGREWVTIEAELVKNQTSGDKTREKRSALRLQLASIDQRISAIDAQLRIRVPQYFAILKQEPASLELVRGTLEADEAVLFLVPTQFGTHAMVITGESFEWSQARPYAQELAADVASLREGLEVGGEFLPLFDLELAHKLYRELIAPVENALAGKERVYVIAGGALSRLPLGTLITQEMEGNRVSDDPAVLREAPWLADRYALVQMPSLQSLIYIRSFAIGDLPEGDGEFRGFGDPLLDGRSVLRGARSATYMPGDAISLSADKPGGTAASLLMNPAALRELAQLPGTARELQQVRAALSAPENTLYLGAAMTETAIREADLSRTTILHLATHGLTSEESGSLVEPGLVFTPPQSAQPEDDGYLTASEIVGIDLTGAQWVILSACNTASPSGKPGETGLSGLAQAFFYAGAQSLMVTHWPVFDDIAPVLTVRALELSRSGMARAQALQAAMREIRTNPEYNAAHPAVWAPFVLVGEGR